MVEADPSARIDERIAEYDDWRGAVLATVRDVIRTTDPDVVEEWKWAKPTSPGVPVWSHAGIICTGEVYTKAVKLTFAKGASLPDPHGLFTSSLGGKVRRAVDITEGHSVDRDALAELVRAAIAHNTATG